MDIAQESFVAVEFGWALLAGMTPGFTDGGAAELFGADDPLQLTLAHVVAYTRETRTRSVICAVIIQPQRQCNKSIDNVSRSHKSNNK